MSKIKYVYVQLYVDMDKVKVGELMTQENIPWFCF